jgi:hypothetical protein
MTAVLSISAALLAGLQSFFNFGDRAVKHATAAANLSLQAGDTKTTHEDLGRTIRESPRVSIKAQRAARAEINEELKEEFGQRGFNPEHGAPRSEQRPFAAMPALAARFR